MPLFGSKQNTTSNQGYVVQNGTLISVPAGQIIYNIPATVTNISDNAKITMMSTAEQIIFSGNPPTNNNFFAYFKNLKIIFVQGYGIDPRTNTLLRVPKSQKIYNIPTGILHISDTAKTEMQPSAEEIIFSSKPSVPNDFFQNFNRLRKLNLQGYIIDAKTGTLVDVPKGLQVYKIPKEVKRLNFNLDLSTNKVLSNMTGASEIIFEDGSIDNIPERYFTFTKAFSNLKRITLPNGIKKLGDNCIDITKTEYNFPISLEHLGKNMYPEVQKLVLKNNIKTLGSGYASHDTNLVYVEVGGSIKELPATFVNQCKNLETLILHEGVEKAGRDAFRNLNGLKYVELPDSFKMPFNSLMEGRSGSNQRGNSKYDGSIFKKQQNNILTIKKTYNGIPFTFQVRRGDFAEISFQNNLAIIKSIDGKSININLTTLTPNAIYQVNIQESKVQQVIQESQKPIQNQIPVQSKQQFQPQHSRSNSVPSIDTEPLDSNFTEEELKTQFQKLYKESIVPSDVFKSLNGSKQIITAKTALYEEFCRRVRATGNLNMNSVILYAIFQSIVKDVINQNNQSYREEIEHLQNLKHQIIENKEDPKEVLESDQGMKV